MLVSPAEDPDHVLTANAGCGKQSDRSTDCALLIYCQARGCQGHHSWNAGAHWSHHVFWSFIQMCCKPRIVQDICFCFLEWQVVSSVTHIQHPLAIASASVLLLTFLHACIAVVHTSAVQLSGAHAVTGRCDLWIICRAPVSPRTVYCRMHG